jgi:hypothetical protein
MPKAITFVLLLTAVVAAAGCGSGSGQAASSSAPLSAPVAAPATTPAAPQSAAPTTDIRAKVSADIDRIMADIKAAEQRGDVVDGVPVGQSSNPYDYVGISPVFTRLVALGRPALPAIAAEIEAGDQDGLREYLLAAAGAQIDGDTPGSGAQTWTTGKEWARQFQEDD